MSVASASILSLAAALLQSLSNESMVHQLSPLETDMCRRGVRDESGTACCAAECGACRGRHGVGSRCASRQGGPERCCPHKFGTACRSRDDVACHLTNLVDFPHEPRCSYQPLHSAGPRTIAKSAESCAARCRKLPGCAYWSWWQDHGCHVSARSSNKVVTKEAVCGVPAERACRFQPSRGSLLLSNLWGQTRESTASKCATRCSETHNCAFYTWNPNDASCNLTDKRARKMSHFAVPSFCGAVEQSASNAKEEESKKPAAKGMCEKGIADPKGAVCCSKGCGKCGGGGCKKRDGGAKKCCIPEIVRAGRSCKYQREVACILDVHAARHRRRETSPW